MTTACHAITSQANTISDTTTLTSSKQYSNAHNSTQVDNTRTVILQQAHTIRTALANHNFYAITKYIHPTKGMRFSMYAYM